MTRAGARLTAFGALFATSGALAAIVLRQAPERAQAGPAVGVHGLVDHAGAVRLELERLRPGRSGRSAQRAVRAAMAATEDLRARAGAAEAGDERTLNALDREMEYLDAVGSLLSNPRSTLAPEIAARGRRARAALAAAPGGQAVAAATSGWDDLLAFARRRADRR